MYIHLLILLSYWFYFIESLYNKKKNKNKRIIVVSILLILIALKNNLFPVRIDPSLTCYYDAIFSLTSGINNYLLESPNLRHSLLCFASLCLDSLIIISYIVWIFDWEDWILFLSIFLFYGIRSIVFALFQIRFPFNYAFDNPGFPSITVSYLITNDFFFSGHVGIPIILAKYYFYKKNNLMVCFSTVVCLVQTIMMVFLRGHYSIDMLYGVIVAYYAYMMGIYLHPHFKKLIRMDDQRMNYLSEQQKKPKEYIIFKDNEELLIEH